MVEFKAVVSDPKTGKSYQTPVSGHQANSLIGKGLGDEFDGIFVGLPGYKLVLTGGADGQGFPMRKDVDGPRRRKVLVSASRGFHPPRHGQRRRKSYRGRTVSQDIVQLNMRISSHGSKAIEDLLTVSSAKE